MGILDEAIREHLELKRQHGADDSELKQLEDEAFGPPERPGGEAQGDALAEAETEFMAQPEAPGEKGDAEPSETARDSSRREEAAARIAGLQEPPPKPTEEAEMAVEAELPPEEPAAQTEEPVAKAEEPAVKAEEPGEKKPAEDTAGAPEVSASGPSTEEREAIAEQPTEMYDVEGELAGGERASREEEPKEEDDDFWDEQRLADELDQALEAPVKSGEEPGENEEERKEPEPTAEGGSEEEEDLLEETPDFLEESPEDDELWFEQKPPKDFDFDD